MTPVTLDPTRDLDASQAQKVSYCIPLWLRDEQIRLNIATVRERFEPTPDSEVRTEPIAIVCYGPSLNDTWEAVRDFRYVMTCSGAHRFLIDRGIVPTWHLDVDPREHKIALIGQPHHDVEYLIAATCHPKYFTLLQDGGYRVKLWHVFDGQDDSLRTLPAGEWAVTGGCSVGLRALTLARLLGFRQLHVFGMDGSEGASGKHAAAHPNQAPLSNKVVYDGVEYRTTPAILEAARQTFHELDQLKDVQATFHGQGLVQAMAKAYVPKPPAEAFIAFNKPELISASYLEQNRRLHRENLAYGVGGGKHAATVLKLAESMKTHSILDYGCGKSYLAKEIPFPIWEYDPAIPGKQDAPRPADIVVCTDVLEHIEPDKLKFVLKDLQRCVKQVGYFVINTGPAKKTLPDGRNTHLIQENEAWWRTALSSCFIVAKIFPNGPLLHVLVGPLPKKKVKPTATPARSSDESTVKLSFATLQFRREPYVIGAATDVLSQAMYQALTDSFPMDVSLYKAFSGGDKKYSLSERNNPEGYHAFVQRSAPWRAFYDYIKAPDFTDRLLKVLAAHKLTLSSDGPFRSRFEFSLLPADGGSLRPHTDIPSKVVTLVIGMPASGDAWQAEWGGGTDVLAPKDPASPLKDYATSREVFDVLHTYPYQANQCVVFLKSDHSWHAVGPLAGPEGQWRRTLTINLERVQ